MTSIQYTVASFNALHPPAAIKWKQKEGLSEAGLNADKKTRKGSLKNGDQWREFSNWSTGRCEEACNTIKASGADFVNLQEIDQEMVSDMLEGLPGYELALIVNKDADSKLKEFGNAILVKKDRVQVLDARVIEHTTTEAFEKNETEFKKRRAACIIARIEGVAVQVLSGHLLGYWEEQANPKINKDIGSKITHEQAFDAKTERMADGYNELVTYQEEMARMRLESSAKVQAMHIGGDFNEDFRERGTKYDRVGYLVNNGFEKVEEIRVSEPGKTRDIDHLLHKTGEGVTMKVAAKEVAQKTASDHLLIADTVTVTVGE